MIMIFNEPYLSFRTICAHEEYIWKELKYDSFVIL